MSTINNQANSTVNSLPELNLGILNKLDTTINITVQSLIIAAKNKLLTESYKNEKKEQISKNEYEINRLQQDINDSEELLHSLTIKSGNSFHSTINNIANEIAGSSTNNSNIRLTEDQTTKVFERAVNINFRKEMLEIKIKGKKESIKEIIIETNRIKNEELYGIIDNEKNLESLIKEKNEMR